jgi:hypothetical protein
VSQRAIVYPLPLKGLTIVSHKCHWSFDSCQ